MKKSQQKKAWKKKANHKTAADDYRLSELGIEPPKIYRESQAQLYQRAGSASSKKSSSRSLSRAEKRKRDSKKRKKRNVMRKVMIWIIAIISFAAIGTVLSLTVFFHIDTISISGNKLYEKNEILNQCTIEKGENLFLSDTRSAKKILEQNLPYIYNAEISRKLPYTIQIKITEAKPAYSIKNKDKTYILLDDNFKVLENKAKKAKGIMISKAQVESSDPGKIIIFKNNKVSECLKQLSDTLKKNNFDGITAIYCNNISDNYVVYENRIEFKLGNCDELDNKIYQGLAACEKLNQTSPNAKGTMTIDGGKQIYFTEK